METDENEILFDSEFTFPFGDNSVTITALPIRDSVKWMRTVKEFLIQNGQRSASQMKQLRELGPEGMIEKGAEILLGTPDEDTMLLIRKLVQAHSPKVFTDEKTDALTARQLGFVFLKMYRFENPFEEIQRGLQPTKT